MGSLADFKRALPVGAKITLKERFGKEVNEERVVGKIQSNSMAFFKSPTNTSLVWLDWPKATLLEFDGKTAKIYDPGYRDFNKEEQAIVDGRPRDAKQEEIDALSDGNTMFWRCKAYYKEKGYEYLFGVQKKEGKRITTQQSKQVIQDDAIKGKLILKYEFAST